MSGAQKLHVVRIGISTSVGSAPFRSDSSAAWAASRAYLLASHDFPDPGPPRMTSEEAPARAFSEETIVGVAEA